MGAPQVRGLAFRGILSATERLHGKDGLAKLTAALPKDLEKGLHYSSIVTSGWYPIEGYQALLAAVSRALGGTPAVRAVGREAALQDFRGIYKVLTFVLSPQFVIKRSPGLFNRYYDTGKLEIPEARAGWCKAVFTGCTKFDPLMWEDAVAGSAGILEACGGKDIAVQFLEGGGDKDHLTITASWS